MAYKNMIKEKEWIKSDIQTFWGEIAPSNHLVQIYDNDEVVMNSIEGFVSSGFTVGDSVIIIATADHLNLLNKRLILKGFDIEALCASNQYIPLDAEETLARFMVVGWPDEERFNAVVTDVLTKARGKDNRRVRAYGEMVAVLWGQGYSGATVQLEHLWNKFCAKEEFCLFCAYPRSGFTQDVHASIGHICSTHTKVISGDNKSMTEVFYKTA